eukprot:GHVS01004073.1.p1 GENE.GHVS01004073.1~~GHVS01004073.1.p1  ORF type:complete len:241 (-),score=39.47 GHVS01004073.1:829-1551(-)
MLLLLTSSTTTSVYFPLLFSSVPLLLVLLSLLSPSLILPSSALFYESQPNARDCFFLLAEENEEIVGSYETFYGDDVLRVTLDLLDEVPVEGQQPSAPPPSAGGRRQLFHSLKETDKFRIAAPRRGKFALCLRNLLSYEQTVTFNTRVQRTAHETHPQDLATTDQTDKLSDMCESLSGKVEDISYQQSHAVTRESVYRQTSESTNSRVLWWTAFQVASLVLLSTLQVFYMRSFFEIKTIV